MIEGDEEEDVPPNKAKALTGETLLVKEYLLEEARPQTRSLSSRESRRQPASKLPSIEQDFAPAPSIRPVTPQSFRPHSATYNRSSGQPTCHSEPCSDHISSFFRIHCSDSDQKDYLRQSTSKKKNSSIDCINNA